METIGKITAWVVGILIADGIECLVKRRRKTLADALHIQVKRQSG